MKEALGMQEDKEAMVHLGDAYQHYIALIASYLTQSDTYTVLLFKGQSQLVAEVLVDISSTLCTSLTPKQRPGWTETNRDHTLRFPTSPVLCGNFPIHVP